MKKLLFLLISSLLIQTVPVKAEVDPLPLILVFAAVSLVHSLAHISDSIMLWMLKNENEKLREKIVSEKLVMLEQMAQLESAKNEEIKQLEKDKLEAEADNKSIKYKAQLEICSEIIDAFKSRGKNSKEEYA